MGHFLSINYSFTLCTFVLSLLTGQSMSAECYVAMFNEVEYIVQKELKDRKFKLSPQITTLIPTGDTQAVRE